MRTSGGRRVGRFPGVLSASAGGTEPVRLLGPALNSISDGLYRGSIEIRPDVGGVTGINVIELDAYVKGVVAGEMPSSWPLEALKVQAVAARTYALATRKTTGTFDQYPDTRSQVYKGVAGESIRSNAAVDQTGKQILTYGGQPAVTYYFSTSGGHTENVEYSFVGSLSKPWLVGVPDPYDYYSPYHRWERPFSPASLDSALGAPGRFKQLKVLERGVSPRVVRARVVGTRGSRIVTGPQVRAALGLPDTWFTDVRVRSSAVRTRSARPRAGGRRRGCSRSPATSGPRRAGGGWPCSGGPRRDGGPWSESGRTAMGATARRWARRAYSGSRAARSPAPLCACGELRLLPAAVLLALVAVLAGDRARAQPLTLTLTPRP